MVNKIAQATGQIVGGGFDIQIAVAKQQIGQDNASATQYKAVMDSSNQMFSSVNQQSIQLAQEAAQASSSQTNLSQSGKV